MKLFFTHTIAKSFLCRFNRSLTYTKTFIYSSKVQVGHRIRSFRQYNQANPRCSRILKLIKAKKLLSLWAILPYGAL